MTKKKTHEEFVKEIYDKYGDEYEILGEYVNARTKIKVKHNCEKCKKYEYYIEPDKLLHDRKCPICTNKKAVLGINTIWDTDRWMCDLGVSEEDAKKYSRGSGNYITVKCPDCGREKKKRIANIYNERSISCKCNDNKPYPEKFVVNLLGQLEVDFKTEHKPKWVDNKRYDFYVKDLNMIIETHGKQHYSNKATFKG
ncbi:hypothetical protein G6Z34_13120 [Clostridium perfringens]|uniref:Uncharacterized protein n=1 Tax=Clostridium perfringens TaxID=1502 RepID=A0AAP7BWJ0_CLOPF|nr:hypothetical protein [Clostridium perfringens]NGU31026.1 hypothetical protein [Clostridium perfringens]